ncbi:MAG: hypothetical protein ACR2K5_13355 [Pseudolabrys sp.]
MLDVYRLLTGRYEVAHAGSGAAVGPAAPVIGALRGSLPGNLPSPRAVAAAAVPDTAGLTSAYADARADRPPAPDTKPLFETMFRTPPRNGVSPVVNSLWSPSRDGADNAVRTLNLFTDTKPGSAKPAGGNV